MTGELAKGLPSSLCLLPYDLILVRSSSRVHFTGLLQAVLAAEAQFHARRVRAALGFRFARLAGPGSGVQVFIFISYN